MSARYIPHTGPAIRWASSRTRYPASGSATATRLHQRLAGWYLRGRDGRPGAGPRGQGRDRHRRERGPRAGDRRAFRALGLEGRDVRAAQGRARACRRRDPPRDRRRPARADLRRDAARPGGGLRRGDRRALGGVDILVNNAGTSAAAGFAEVDDATWQADIELKLMAAIRLCRLVIPHMKRRGGGRIVNVTTVGGKAPAARSLPTSRTPAAGSNLTKSLANEYAADRILVNTI